MPNKIDYQKLFELKWVPGSNFRQFDQLILGIDPSGNVLYGKGHIGVSLGGVLDIEGEPCLFILETHTVNLDKVKAEDNQKLEYAIRWLMSQIKFLNKKTNLHVICENYIDYQGAFTKYKEPETYYIVKALENFCIDTKISFTKPRATEHKTRFSNHVLFKDGVQRARIGDRHSQDATRMVLWWFMFKYEHQKKKGF